VTNEIGEKKAKAKMNNKLNNYYPVARALFSEVSTLNHSNGKEE
jgi:hypothetical protein